MRFRATFFSPSLIRKSRDGRICSEGNYIRDICVACYYIFKPRCPPRELFKTSVRDAACASFFRMQTEREREKTVLQWRDAEHMAGTHKWSSTFAYTHVPPFYAFLVPTPKLKRIQPSGHHSNVPKYFVVSRTEISCRYHHLLCARTWGFDCSFLL